LALINLNFEEFNAKAQRRKGAARQSRNQRAESELNPDSESGENLSFVIWKARSENFAENAQFAGIAVQRSKKLLAPLRLGVFALNPQSAIRNPQFPEAPASPSSDRHLFHVLP